jgi:hypothetical protein
MYNIFIVNLDLEITSQIKGKNILFIVHASNLVGYLQKLAPLNDVSVRVAILFCHIEPIYLDVFESENENSSSNFRQECNKHNVNSRAPRTGRINFVFLKNKFILLSTYDKGTIKCCRVNKCEEKEQRTNTLSL